jgi:glutamine phosphoribosylpyrophosphate amidotransferase
MTTEEPLNDEVEDKKDNFIRKSIDGLILSIEKLKGSDDGEKPSLTRRISLKMQKVFKKEEALKDEESSTLSDKPTLVRRVSQKISKVFQKSEVGLNDDKENGPSLGRRLSQKMSKAFKTTGDSNVLKNIFSKKDSTEGNDNSLTKKISQSLDKIKAGIKKEKKPE